MANFAHRGNRTIVWSGVISGHEKASVTYSPPLVLESTLAEERFEIVCFGCVFTLGYSTIYTPFPSTRDANITLTVSNIQLPDPTLTDTDTVAVPWTVNTPGLNWDMVGSWSVSVDCEELVVVETLGEFPSYGGARTADQTLEALTRFKLRTRVGGNIVATCSCGGLNVSITRPITLANRTFVDNYSAIVTLAGTASGVNGECAVTMLFDGVPIGAEGVNWDNDYGSATGSAAIAQNGSVSTDYSRLSVRAAPVKRYNLNVAVRAMADAYPGSMTLCVSKKDGWDEHPIAAGGGVIEGAQRQFAADAQIGPASGTLEHFGNTLDEWSDLRCWIKADSLIAAGEDTRLWRVMQRGWRFNSFTVRHAETYTHETGSWAAVGTANLTRTYSPAKSFQAYRFLRLTVSASAGGSAFTVRLGTKEWTTNRVGNALVAGTSAANFEIDLCIPTNQTAESDTQDTRWPIDGAEGPYWGVGNVGSLVLTGLAAGVTYTLTKVEQFWLDATRTQFLSPFDWWKLATGLTTSENQRLMLGMTDWKQSLEESGLVRDDGPGDEFVYLFPTLTQLIADINAARNPGWAAVGYPFDFTECGDALPPLRDCLLNNSLPALFAEGNGAIYDGSWQHSF